MLFGFVYVQDQCLENNVNKGVEIKESNNNKLLGMKQELYDLIETLTTNTEIQKLNYKTAIYYANDMVGCGKKYIISNTFGNHNRMSMISSEEVNFQMCMSRFASKLPRSMAIEFGSLLSYIKKIYCHPTANPVCPLPNSHSDLRRAYIDGDTAISKNVPTPIASMHDDHSIVSLIDCVADFVIRKNKLVLNIDNWDHVKEQNQLKKDMNIFCCERAIEIINDAKSRVNEAMLERTLPIITLFITIWSDDFDPNKSVKNNRQSVWIKTATIFSMDESGNKIQGTYVLSLAKKATDHDIVERLILIELNKLRSGKLLMMYSRSHKSLVYVHADIFCVMNDQPERRTNLHLSNGNSSVHGCFGLLLNCKMVQNYIRSCDLCKNSIIKEANTNKINNNKWRSKKCKKCTAWLYNIESPLLHFSPEKSFPLSLLDNKLLKPTKITKSTIERSVNRMLEKYRKSEISIVQARCYLKYMGINNNIIMDILNNKNEVYHVPSSWYNFNDLTIYVNVPMHLLMLGVVKSVILKIGKWLRFYNLNSRFIKMSSGILDAIKSLNVEWCKILAYPKTDKTGGWVSENFVAMGRLGLWFYSLLLHVPGLDSEKVEVNNIMNLVYSMCLMLKKCMSLNTTKSDINHLESIIRMFLIYYDIIDQIINDSGTPSWISQYNMICLLNLPDTMRKYGHMRNIWEGGTDGESYLKHVKKQLSSGLVNQWQVWAITNLLKEDIYRDWKPVNNSLNHIIKNEIKIYCSKEDAKESYNSGKPISLLIYDEYKYICFRKSGDIIGVRIRLTKIEVIQHSQVCYSMHWTNSKINIDTTKTNCVGVIMLPLIGVTTYSRKEESSRYCLIRSDWEKKK